MSVLAAMLHAEVAPEHWQEWWGYGAFFIVSAAAQLVYGLLLLLFAIHLEARLPSWARSERLLYASGIVGNGALIALYVWTRTVGNFAGPATGEIEPVELIGILSKAAEVALVGMLVIALWKGADTVERRALAASAA